MAIVDIKDLSIIEYSSLIELTENFHEAVIIQFNVIKLLKRYNVNKDTIKDVLKHPLFEQVKFVEMIKSFGGFVNG